MEKPRALAGDTPIYCAYDEIVDAVMLVPNPRNPNRHPPEQIKALAKIITAQGWRACITVSRRSGFIVRGHGRLEAALAAGLEQVPVEYQEYKSEAAEWADMVADNRIAELAHIDPTEIHDLLSDLEAAGTDITLTGYSEDEVTRMLAAGEFDLDSFFVEAQESGKDRESVDDAEITCPHCGQSFSP